MTPGWPSAACPGSWRARHVHARRLYNSASQGRGAAGNGGNGGKGHAIDFNLLKKTTKKIVG
jgi:hypothetical protein